MTLFDFWSVGHLTKLEQGPDVCHDPLFTFGLRRLTYSPNIWLIGRWQTKIVCHDFFFAFSLILVCIGQPTA